MEYVKKLLMNTLTCDKKFFSIIITFKKNSKNLEKCLQYLNKQTFKNFETILVSENFINVCSQYNNSLKITKIITKSKYPGIKRHIGTKIAKGRYLVFIDDDAYPHYKWLKEYYNIIKVQNNVAYGGPAIDEYKINKLNQKILSFIYKVKFFGGFPERYISLKKKIVDDWPSVNLCIKKEDYDKTKGLNHKFWPGEDSLLCNEIFYKLNKKIQYTPKAIVYHVRRLDFKNHIKQLFGYGKMRGLFFCNKIENSFKLKYTIPTLFFLYNVFLIASYFFFKNKIIFFPIYIYFLANIYLTYKTIVTIGEKKKMTIIFAISNFINHNIYGLAFLIGITSKKKLKESI